MRSFTSPKKKIILVRSKVERKIENRTATFGGCLLAEPSLSDISELSNPTQSACQDKLTLVCKLFELFQFYQQLDVVYSFNLIRSRSDVLLKSQKYLEEKIKNRNIRNALNKLKVYKQHHPDIIEHQTLHQQIAILDNKYVKIESYKMLQKRVKQLETLVKENLQPKYHKPLTSRQKRLSTKKYKLQLPQISTDSGMSRVVYSYFDPKSPLSRRCSINLDESNDEYSCLSFRTSKEKEKGKRKSVVVLKSKFIKGLH